MLCNANLRKNLMPFNIHLLKNNKPRCRIAIVTEYLYYICVSLIQKIINQLIQHIDYIMKTMKVKTLSTLCLSILLGVSCSSSVNANTTADNSTPVTVHNNRAGIDFTQAAESTVNGVVSVKNYSTPSVQYNQRMNDPILEYFFGPQFRGGGNGNQDNQPRERLNGLGSGVILSTDGYIVTNNHVIEGADRLEVVLNDNRTLEATLVGTDPLTDIALIKIEADDLHVIPMGDSDLMRVGEWVLAVGNPFGLTSTVTAGIVSAKARSISNLTPGSGEGRRIESYIQTDAAINPGNSGGALVNLDGQLIGINTAIFSQTGNYSGSSFAVPTSIVKKVVKDIKEFGTVQRAVLGIRCGELNPTIAKEHNITATNSGLVVGSIEEGSGAQEAGLKEYDVIVAIDNSPTNNMAQLQEIIARHRPGETVKLTVIRDNKSIECPVTLRNSRGDTKVTVAGTVASLGCVFKQLTPQELKQLNRRSGVKVESVQDGKFKKAGIRDGFIIFDINNMPVNSAADVEKVYDAIVQSDEYDHVMFITGSYSGKRKQYYAVDLATD